VSLEVVIEDFMHGIEQPEPANLRKEPKYLIALVDTDQAMIVVLRNT